jgi:hypothetical protein
MAAAENTLTKFREELTCSLCRELFKKPKTLSCLHSFCEKCLSDHIQKRTLDNESGIEDNRKRVPCPLCKHVQVLAEPDVKEVKTNLGYKNMVQHLSLEEGVRGSSQSDDGNAAKCDLCIKGNKAAAFCTNCNGRLCERCRESHQDQKATVSHTLIPLEDLSSSSSSGDEVPLVTHYTWKCDKHGDIADPLREVVLYCATCDEMICRECSFVQPHGNHDKFEAKKIINDPEYKPRIEKHEKDVERVEGEFSTFIAEMKDLQERLNTHKDAATKKIDARVKDIHDLLEKDKSALVAKVNQIFAAKNKRLQDQIEELEEIEKTLKGSRKVVNDVMKVGIPAEILFLMETFISRLKSLFDQYDMYDRTPRENDILQFSPNAEFDLSGAIGAVAADPFPEAFTLDGLDSIHFIQGKEAPLTVTCRDIAGTPRPIKHDIKVELCPPANGDALQGTVEKDVDKGTYKVKLQPNSQGDHELKVSVVVGNEEKCVPIAGSPFKVRVSRPLLGGIEAENIAIAGLQNPWGIAVWRGAKPEGREGENGEPGGARDGAGGEGEDAGVRDNDGAGGQDDAAGAGNAENGEVVAITDIGTHRLLIVTNNDFQNPQWIGKEGGGEGDGNSEFNSPRGVAFNKNGDIVVVDKDNCRVQVISAEGEFKSKFGKRGSENGEFRRPTDVAIDARGTIYVSDTDNNRIQYFKPDGRYLGQFGGPGTFSEPYALTCDELGRIFVTERQGNHVQCLVSKPPDAAASNDRSSSVESSYRVAGFEIFFRSESLSNEPLGGIAHHPETGYIVVTEMSKRHLSILDKNGHVLAPLGTEGERDNEFLTPMGVSVLGDSRLIVCDCGKRKLMIFSIV